MLNKDISDYDYLRFLRFQDFLEQIKLNEIFYDEKKPYDSNVEIDQLGDIDLTFQTEIPEMTILSLFYQDNLAILPEEDKNSGDNCSKKPCVDDTIPTKQIQKYSTAKRSASESRSKPQPQGWRQLEGVMLIDNSYNHSTRKRGGAKAHREKLQLKNNQPIFPEFKKY